MSEKKLTGYPSIDKPWLKYYSEEAINAPLPECTIYEYLWENNKDHLDDIAFQYYGTKWTYNHFFDELKKTVSSFHNNGIKSGDIVTIMSMHTPETIVCMYALNYIGAICNMVYVSQTVDELRKVISDTESKMLLILDLDISKINQIAERLTVPVVVLEVADSMPLTIKTALKVKNRKNKISTKAIRYNSFVDQSSLDSIPQHFTNENAVAVMVYTSGTTGEPKGVMLSNYNINAIVKEVETTYVTSPRKQTFLNAIPPFLGFGVTMLHLAFCNGIEQIILLTADPDEIADAIIKYKPNRIVYGPKLTEAIIRNVKGDLSFLIDFTGGGEEISAGKEAEINSFLAAHGAKCKYTTGYGMSETTSAVSIQQNHIYRIASIGIPLPAINVKVVDTETNEELPFNSIGELCYSTPSLMVGYYKNKAATDDVIETDIAGTRWIHTGDLGYVDNDGFTFVKGRIKRIYTTFGNDGSMYKLFPQRIEDFVSSLPAVKYCGCIVVDDPVKLHLAEAFVELNDPSSDSEAIIRNIEGQINKELPDHLWPKSIRIIDLMPLTASGKIDYRELEKQAEEMSKK